MNIVGLGFLVIGTYLIHLNKSMLNISEKKVDKSVKFRKLPKKVINNTDINTIKEELFWKPSPWEYLHGYKVDIKNKRFY
jgi:hypothetical protein